jgi:hypothetical protein
MKTKIQNSIAALVLCTCVFRVVAAHAGNIIQNGDFSLGNTNFNSDYIYIPYDYADSNLTATVKNGHYTVAPYVPPSFSDWLPFHTVSGGNSQMLVVDGSTNPSTTVVWSQSVPVAANTTYSISFYLAEIGLTNILATNAVYLGGSLIGIAAAPSTQDVWQQFSFTWNSGFNTNVLLAFEDLDMQNHYNDFAIDNISMSAVPPPSIPGLFNTGVDGTGTVLPYDTTDPHYTQTGPLSGAIVINRRVNSSTNQWVIPPDGSAWIGPVESNTNSPVGVYTYTFTFNLTGFNPATAVITGEVASDNDSHIILNGTDTGISPTNYMSLMNISLTNGFVSGTNILEVTVTNTPPQSGGGSPSGLLIANLVGTAQPMVASILGISLSGTNLVINGSNGLAGETYHVLATTNVSLPFNQWTPVATNVLNATGNFTFTATNAVNPNSQQQFYILQLQ